MEVLIIVLAVLVALGLATFLLGNHRRGTTAPAKGTPRARRPKPAPPGGPAAVEEASTPQETPGGGSVATLAPPEEAAPAEEAEEEAAAVAVAVETPEPTAGRLVRLRSRLARSQSTLGKGLLSLLSRDKLDEATWEEIEETLLIADVGVAPTTELVERLRTRVRVLGTRTPAEVRALLREELVALLGLDADRALHTARHAPVEAADGAADSADAAPAGGRPAVVLVVGVNGAGKTTTTGKLARVLVADGRSVVLGAADTFRAAAVDQLQTWGDRVGATTIRGPEGSDPASVAFDAVKHGIEAGVDTVVIDTAGRLHTKTGLMDELGKVKRVVSRHGPVDEVLLVLDATTGQNGLVQARVFAEVVDITGIALTKLDGSAKGGIVIAVQRELGVPVKLVGLGEGPDDLAPFDPETFVDALVGE